MAPAEILERLDDLKRASKPGGHISVTELARSSKWRTELPEVGVMEITDRGQTAGWLVSEKDIEAIVYAVIDLQKELEQASLEAMFQTRYRDDPGSWRAGKPLEVEAMSYLDEHYEEIAAVMHDDK